MFGLVDDFYQDFHELPLPVLPVCRAAISCPALLGNRAAVW